MPNEPLRCRHIHAEGRQCGSPAIRGEKLCYQHQSARRPALNSLRLPILPDPEDLPAVQRGLAELLRLVARDLIDDKQAKRLFAILAQAGTNLARIERGHRAERILALAEARFAARHPEHARKVQYPTTTPEDPVTDLVDDPELGLIAPGPDPEPRPESPTGYPTLTTASSSLGWASITPKKPCPEQPTRARQAELDAEAAAELEFQRREKENIEERQRLRIISREVMYPLLSPKGRAREDALRAAEQAEVDNPDPHYLLQNVRSTPKNEQNSHLFQLAGPQAEKLVSPPGLSFRSKAEESAFVCSGADRSGVRLL